MEPTSDRRSIGSALDPRRNSLNCLRLLFALFVVVGHGSILGGYRWRLALGDTGVENIAVDGFFAISGYLIAGSALRSNTIRYLWQRVLRIFPAFWICLLAVAFGFGTVGWLHGHSSLRGYFTGDRGAISYIFQNSALRISHYDINGTPAHVPYPYAWNGSLWTLEYEFMCYLLVGALALLGLLRRRMIAVGLLVVSWGLEAIHFYWPQYLNHFPNQMRFVPIFMAGTVLYLYRNEIRDSKLLFVGIAILYGIGCYTHDSGHFAGPLLAYLCIWLGAHLPMASVGAKNDLSYGVYIYAFPVTELLAVWGVNRWGAAPYLVLITAATLVLAGLSWKLIEQPALRAKRWSPTGLLRREPVPAAAVGE